MFKVMSIIIMGHTYRWKDPECIVKTWCWRGQKVTLTRHF